MVTFCRFRLVLVLAIHFLGFIYTRFVFWVPSMVPFDGVPQCIVWVLAVPCAGFGYPSPLVSAVPFFPVRSKSPFDLRQRPFFAATTIIRMLPFLGPGLFHISLYSIFV